MAGRHAGRKSKLIALLLPYLLLPSAAAVPRVRMGVPLVLSCSSLIRPPVFFS